LGSLFCKILGKDAEPEVLVERRNYIIIDLTHRTYSKILKIYPKVKFVVNVAWRL
jgi:hypothetical protein